MPTLFDTPTSRMKIRKNLASGESFERAEAWIGGQRIFHSLVADSSAEPTQRTVVRAGIYEGYE